MAHKYLIGIDNGTSGAKCIAVDETGKVAASATVRNIRCIRPALAGPSKNPRTGGTLWRKG